MNSAKSFSVLFLFLMGGLWYWLSQYQTYRSDLFPYIQDFALSFQQELRSGRLWTDVIASLYRWACGFLLATLIGVPAGLVLGKSQWLRDFSAPYLNFLRSLSPLAWIPFAVIWFGIGDLPVVFLIFLGCVFPLLFTTMNAVFHVPKVYDQLANDYHFKGSEYFFEILLPSIMPQVVSSLRLVSGMAWIVLVPGEMLAGKEGLGFAILDARNGMRTDLLVLNMIAIALLAHFVDVIMQRLNQRSQIRWSYEQ